MGKVKILQEDVRLDSSKVLIRALSCGVLSKNACDMEKGISEGYSKNNVFLDIPYANYDDCESALHEILTSGGLNPVTAKGKVTSQAMLCKICKLIKTCKYGVSDISSGSNSVSYEYGLMHGFGMNVALLMRENTDKFSDITGIEHLQYNDLRSFKVVLSKWLIENVAEANKDNLKKILDEEEDALKKGNIKPCLIIKQTEDIIEQSSGTLYAQIESLRERADAEWPPEVVPFIEVSFCAKTKLALTPDQLRLLIPGATIKVQHGFPLTDFGVQSPVAWGWYGRIPFTPIGQGGDQPYYLWLLSRDGCFLDRDHLWEDDQGSVIPGGIGIFHLISRIVLLIRFAQNFGNTLDINLSTPFRLGVRVAGSKGRVLMEERGVIIRLPYVPSAIDSIIEASQEVPLSILRNSASEIALNLLEELSWQFQRHDWTREDLSIKLRTSAESLGTEYQL